MFEESMRNEQKIAKQINDMLEESKKIRIIKETKTENNIVKLNDIVEVEFIYPNGDKEIDKLKITGNYKSNMDSEIIEVTINGPIGQAIYHKKIQEECSYYVNDDKIIIKILKIKSV